MSKDEGDALTAAAAALEAELRRYEELAAAAQKIPLTSGKNLDRAAKATSEAAASQERVAAQVGALVKVIAEARERQQATAEGLAARAVEIQQRTTVFQELLRAFGELGTAARTINEVVERAAASNREGASPEERAEAVPRINEALEKMDLVGNTAQQLAELAEKHQIEDIGRQADSLRQQIVAARNKLKLLHQKLAGAQPN